MLRSLHVTALSALALVVLLGAPLTVEFEMQDQVLMDMVDDQSITTTSDMASPDSSSSLAAFMTLLSFVTQHAKTNRMEANPASRRNQLEVMLDILTLTEGAPMSRKRILRSANLSQRQLKRYMALLMSKGLLTEQKGANRTYRVTQTGCEFIRILTSQS